MTDTLYGSVSTAYSAQVPGPQADDPAFSSIWERPQPAGRRPRLRREQIASAALAIADAEGFGAASMRRIAADLGSGTMSLYRYIATKDELAALMGDALMGETIVPDGELPADWRGALAMVARRTRDMYLRHPWAARELHDPDRGAPPGPNGLRHAEQSLAALAGAPFDTRGKLDLLALVDDFVAGHVLRAAGPQRAIDAGQAEQRFELGLQALIDGAFRAWAYPAAGIP